ncbi:hypothetical protein GCM10010411_91260 [Actinomadura fulvescens]|uniref:Uncharacterized protein n=1 Tax=Actinomadura fulvescens TaxID=46160 RepID=A0ABN3QWU4_9ACTN
MLGEGGGDHAAAGVADDGGAPDAEPVQRRADPTCLVPGRVAAVGWFGRLSVPEQVDPDDAMGVGQQRNHRVR